MIITAPGWMTYSRITCLPSGNATVSRNACRKLPLNSSWLSTLRSFRWLSSHMIGSTGVGMAAEIAPNETREGEGDEERARHGVELPALRRDLSGALFKQQAHAADDEVHENQFGQPQRKRLRLGQGHNGQQPLVHEREVGADEGQHDH